MANVFRIPEDKRVDVAKMVERYERKAAKYGIPFNVTFGEPYAADIPVREIDFANHGYIDHEPIKVEVFDLTIDAGIIRKDGYDVVARIEHLDGGNVVNAFGKTEVKDAWRTAKGICQHCGINRDRKVTFIVRRDDTDVQVGSSCLHDYCGIDPMAIGYRNELVEYLEGEDLREYDWDSRPNPTAFDVVKMLALAKRAIKAQGYIKSSEPKSNKSYLWSEVHASVSEDEYKAADEIAKAIAAMDSDEAAREGMADLQSIIKSGYCKESHFGYLAYAPLAWDRYIERVAKRAAWEAEKATEKDASNYVGEVGQRIVIEVASMRLVTSFETEWGYTYLYKFVDKNGNVFVWFSSGTFGYWKDDNTWVQYESVDKIKGTVKAHNEKDGVKQTVLNRVKVA